MLMDMFHIKFTNNLLNLSFSVWLYISFVRQVNMKSNPLIEKSFAFSLEIISLYKSLILTQKEYVISKQLLKCSTSIGANIAESNGAISKADFSAKVSIAYKESLESKYWLRLLKESGYISGQLGDNLLEQADELSRILYSILKSTRINK